MKPSDIQVTVRRLDPAEAELWVSAPERFSGRWVGPRCRYASTVEIAYYARPLPPGPVGPPSTQRVIIPEPSFWEPTTPFLYTGIYQAGPVRINVTHGLRTIHLGPAGLRVNRLPFRIRGAWATGQTDLAALRDAGVNTLLCAVAAETSGLWEKADELGLFVLGVADVTSEPAAAALAGHPSCLGWLFEGEHGPSDAARLTNQDQMLGTLLRAAPAGPLPSWVRFVAGAAHLLGPVTGVPVLPIGEEASAGMTLGTIDA